MVFVARPLEATPKTLGEKLRALRRSQAVSMEMLERMTRVQRKYLEALEWGRYADLPEPMYAKNFLRSYTRALKADETYFLELYEEEAGRTDLLDPHRLPRGRVERVRLFVLSQLTSAIALLCVVAIVFGYVGYQGYQLLRPPSLALEAPEQNIETRDPLLTVRGSVMSDEVTVRIDNELVPIRADKTFETTIDLSRGLNVVRVEARRRYSRSTVIERTVVLTMP